MASFERASARSRPWVTAPGSSGDRARRPTFFYLAAGVVVPTSISTLTAVVPVRCTSAMAERMASSSEAAWR